jgi:hypothetical protein
MTFRPNPVLDDERDTATKMFHLAVGLMLVEVRTSADWTRPQVTCLRSAESIRPPGV